MCIRDSGRTGRAGHGGQVLSLCSPREVSRAHVLEERQGKPLRWKKLSATVPSARSAPPATMATLRIDAGKTDKLRPGDILGALTGDAGLHASAIGKIDIFATRSYVAIPVSYTHLDVYKRQQGHQCHPDPHWQARRGMRRNRPRLALG